MTSASAESRLNAVFERELNGDECLFAGTFAEHWMWSDHKRDFVIDISDVNEWLGFARKDACKRAISNALDLGVHYIVNASKYGAPNKEDILLSVNGFKRMCMSITTEKAETVRDCYVALDNAIRVYVKEEADERLRASEEEKNALRRASEAEKDAMLRASEEEKEALRASEEEKEALRAKYEAYVENTNRLLKRRYADGQKGDVTYIYKDTNDPRNIVFNVGKTYNAAQREQDYSTYNFSGEMIYTKRCLNRDILEKVAHHMMDQYRIVRNREWFLGTEEVLKDTLNTAQAVLDGYVDRCRNMLATGVGAKIRDLIASVPRDDEQPDHVPDYVVADIKAAEEKATRMEAINFPKAAPTPEFEPITVKNPDDYDAFVADMCEVREDAYTLAAELMGAHRLWSRCSSDHVKRGLITYLRQKFPRSKREFDDKSQRLVHVGVAMKSRPPAIPEPSDESTDIQLFLHAECREDYVGRVSMKALVSRFEAWKRSNGDGEYKLCEQDRRRLMEHLNTHFLYGTPCTTSKGDPEYGYYGLIFKDDVEKVGLRDNNNLRKRVMVLDPKTQPATLMRVFDSVQACAAWFGTVASSISTDLSHNRMRKGLLLKKVAAEDDELIKTHDPATAPDAPPGLPREKVAGTGQWKNKAVEEIDAKTGKVVQVFDTVKAAAEDASVESARMSTIISKGRKLGNFYYRFAKPEDEAGPSSSAKTK